MAYADLNTIHDPATGTVAPAAWGDQVRDNFEFLVDPPVCSIADPTGSSVATATTVALGAAATESFDNDAMHSDVTDRGRITVQTPGRYLLMGTVFYSPHVGADTAFIRVSLRVNGVTAYGGMQIKGQAAADEGIRIQATRSLVLAAGDYVEVTTFHSLGGTITATLDEFLAMFLTR